jgi:hypothetical protein
MNTNNAAQLDLSVRNSYHQLAHVFAARPPIWKLFEVLLQETENRVKGSYAQAGMGSGTASGQPQGGGQGGQANQPNSTAGGQNQPNPAAAARRAQIERSMLIHASLPDSLMPVIKQLLTKVFGEDEGVLARVYPADIMFRDYSWLCFTEDRVSRAWHKKYVVDVLRKIIVRRERTNLGPVNGVKSGINGAGDTDAETDGNKDKEKKIGNDNHDDLVAGLMENTDMDGTIDVNGAATLDGLEGRDKKTRWKRCTRGCAFVEDILPGNKDPTVSNALYWHVCKNCVCGNGWVVVD